MTKQEKLLIVDGLKLVLEKSNVVYIADTQGLNANLASKLRRSCFNDNIKITVVKNTLIKKAMEKIDDKDYSEVYPSLNGNSTVLFSEVRNAPAKLIQNFRKKSHKPVLKSAWIDQVVYTGDKNLDVLIKLKSREELVGEIISILQSPIKNTISSLTFISFTLLGIVKTLSNKNNIIH